MDGILNINKSQGMTSFAVVAAVKRLTGEKHAGHAGTLDPLATGVLPVCLGQATRVIQYLFNETKTYRAQIELGVSTDTYDSTGKVIRTGDITGISREMVEAALANFRGQILQTPPMYSAVKHQGRPLYKLARSGIEVERQPRPAQIYSLEIRDWQPPLFTLEVICGKGTYIRSLAHDLGEALGCGAIMKALVRLRVGPFGIDEALTLEQLSESFGQGRGQDCLYPIDVVLTSYNAIVVSHEQQCSLIHGSPITFELTRAADSTAEKTGSRSRVYTGDGRFLGIARYDSGTGQWQPEKIFLRSCCGGQED